MGKHKNATKGGRGVQKGASPTPSSHGGEQGDTGNTANDLIKEEASMEDVFSHMGTPSDSHNWADCHPNDPYHLSINKTAQWPQKTHYCIQMRVTLG